jgi:geranylgeranyl pyrophosphate synthase
VAQSTCYSDITALVAPQLQRIEDRLGALCSRGAPALCEAARAALLSGGKRLRPVLVLLSAQAAGTPTTSSEDLAVAVEIIHVASLLHDDVMDEATLRRGKPAVRKTWGNRMAVLVGDYLAAAAYYELAGLDSPQRYVGVLAQVAMSMCGSEATFAAGGGQVTPEQCLEVDRGKTAALISACCELGALSVAAPEDYVGALREYGENLGLAFQITDDLLDLYGRADVTGKAPGRDAITGQLTYPIVAALHGSQGVAVQEALERVETDPDALPALSAAVEAAGGRTAARDLARRLADAALAALGRLSPADPGAVQALADLVEFTIQRDH